MSLEFTGERVVPGQVDPDLWNEHFSRYVLTADVVRGRARVLDVGCGAGYGSALLADSGAAVTALDVSRDAVAAARSLYGSPERSLRWTCGSATDLPFRDQAFDAVAAFEVIEHLKDWDRLIAEAARVLAPDGLFVVSTPNTLFYAETRAESGPNPYHEHEFEYAEFDAALAAHFPYRTLYLQNHIEGVAFQAGGCEAKLKLEASEPPRPEEANFFVAVCSRAPLPDLASLLYIPQVANALREKLRHIERLNAELRQKDAWLAEEQARHQQLLEEHRQQTGELRTSQEWARGLDEKLTAQGERIVKLQDELAQHQQAASERIRELEAELKERTEWALSTERSLREELDSRTTWARGLERELEERRAMLAGAAASRWVKLGRAIGVGPELKQNG